MKVTDRLIGDHKTFLKMIADIDAIVVLPPAKRDPNKLIRLVELFRDHLILHSWFEDKFFYPEIVRVLDGSIAPRLTPTYMTHLEEEHKTIDGYLDTLEREVKKSPAERSWPQTFALFAYGLRAHMRKEEEELFPGSEKLLGHSRLEALSGEIEKHRSEAPRIRIHTRAE